MVKVINAHKRTKDGKPFMVLELQGNMELVQSSVNGRFYATSKRCFITSTFTEEVANAFIGNSIEGEIVRSECDPYTPISRFFWSIYIVINIIQLIP